MRLINKVALITGAGSGVGRASALRFAAEGAVLYCTDSNEMRLRETLGLIREVYPEAQVDGMAADVSIDEDCSASVAEATERFHRLDILFSNAGLGGRGDLLSTSSRDYERIMATNLKGAFLMAQAAVPVMQLQGSGVILFTASQYGLAGALHNPVYAASKGGVIALARSLALDYAPAGIRVNCICPGLIDTALQVGRVGDIPEPAAAVQQRVSEIPLQRLGTAEEVANVALFLVSDEASFMTGETVLVDGGFVAQ
jgi:meso-butanediol dehydrogenase / (S,S)-butanediol dehydrogenase / diacetyl reductase